MSRIAVAAVLVLLGTACAAADKGEMSACPSPLSTVILNSCVVTPGVLWRGSKPGPAGAASLLSLGIRTVVNLEMLHSDMKAFESALPAKVPSGKLSYFHIHELELNALLLPSVVDSHVAEFLAIVKTQPKPIYVHCRAGQNRTGVMVAAYRVLLEGASPESAVAEMAKYKGIWFKADAAYIKSLVGDHRAKVEAMIQTRVKDVHPAAILTCSISGCKEEK